MRIKVIILPAKIDCHIVLSGCKRSRMLKLLIGDFRRYKIEGIVQEILSFRFEPSFSHFRIHFSRCVYRFIYFYLPALIYHGCHIQPLSQFCRLSSALQISACYLPRQVKLMWQFCKCSPYICKTRSHNSCNKYHFSDFLPCGNRDSCLLTYWLNEESQVLFLTFHCSTV